MDIFALQSTRMKISVSLLCLFVHEPPYQTTVVCCNPAFRCGYLCMDHPTVFTCFPRSLRLAQLGVAHNDCQF